MKIKKFRAADSAQALRMIREELGDDVAILTSYSVPNGVEYVVTVDTSAERMEPIPVPLMSRPGSAAAFYDWQSDNPQIKAGSLGTPSYVMPATLAQDTLAALTGRHGSRAPRQEIDSSVANQRQADDMRALKAELGTMRALLETHLRNFAARDLPMHESHSQDAMAQLQALDISADLSRQLLAGLLAEAGSGSFEKQLQQRLEIRIPIAQQVLQGITAVLGSTGAGKTTTLVKLAARHVLRHGCDDIAIISTDTTRVGAMDQLRAYGRILQVPVMLASTSDELRNCLFLNRDKKLVLIDTPALSNRDSQARDHLAQLLAVAPQMTQLLVLAADSETHAASELLSHCAPFAISAVVLTRLDLAARLGGLLSLLISQQLGIAWCCAGSRVPHDLKPADAVGLVELTWQLAGEAVDQLHAPEALQQRIPETTQHLSAGFAVSA